MSSIAVQNIPVQPRRDHSHYPIEELAIGQSFLIKSEEPPTSKDVSRVRNAIRYYLNVRPKLKGKYRVIADPKGIRVGRIA